jgi:hypothetical protein
VTGDRHRPSPATPAYTPFAPSPGVFIQCKAKMNSAVARM